MNILSFFINKNRKNNKSKKSKKSKHREIWQGRSFTLDDIITPSTFIGGNEHSPEPSLGDLQAVSNLDFDFGFAELFAPLEVNTLEMLNPQIALSNNQIINSLLAEPTSQYLALSTNSYTDISIFNTSNTCSAYTPVLNGESPSGKELPGITTFPGAKAPIVPLTNVDTGGNNLENATSIVRSTIVDVIDQVSGSDPTDIFRVNINDLKNADISVLSGEISVNYLMPSGQFLGSQVFSKGNYTLQLPVGVTGDVVVKIDNKGDTPGTYSLNGFESKAAEPFNIDLEFEGGLTTSQQEIIRAAAKSVEAIITKGLPTAIVDGKLIDDVNFKISATNLDGAGGTAARTKIDFMRFGTMLPAQSITQFDAADIADLERSGELFSVVEHELLHGLGFGNLWEAKGLVDYAGTPLAQYNGKDAVKAFNELGGLTDNIALENEGNGSAGLHWNENLFQDEVMTADYNNGKGGNAPISAVTIASLADLGYQVNLNRATPDFGLFGGQKFKQEDLTPEQIEAFRQLAETSFGNPDEEFIYATMPEVDPDTVAPEIWAHAERAPNGEYYEWVDYQVQQGDNLSKLAQRFLGNGTYWYYKWIGDHNGIKNYNYLYWNSNDPSKNWIKVPGRHLPNYEWEQEQERLRREAELRQRQKEEARIRREQEEAFAREQERVRQEAEARQREAEAKKQQLEEQERRLREEMERRRQEEERLKEEARLRELERQEEITRQQGKGGLDWFVAKPLPEFGPVDPFETRLTGETVGNLVPDDYYRFTLSRNGRITAELKQLLADADLVLYDVRNRPISYSMRDGITDEQLIADLIPGTYMLRVNSPKGVTTDYELIVKFKHLLSQSEKGPPPGWRVGGGNGGNGVNSGSSGGGGNAGQIFADPRIKRIYDTALNNFVIPERAKANTRIQQLGREKQSYEQELQQLLNQMNGEQRAKVHRALDGIRDERRAWVDSVANPIKNGIDSTADWIINQIESKIPSQAYDIPWLGDQLRSAKDSFKGAVNGARSWLKGKVDWVQTGVKDAIWQFTEVLKNAYRTGAEINGAIETAAQQLKQTIDNLVVNINNWVGEFKGKVLDSVQWLRNVGVDIPSVGWGWLKTPGFKWNFYDSVVEPLANNLANGIKSSVTSVGDFAKGTVDWIKPRAQTAVAAVVDAIFGDKTGTLYNKIHGVDQQIEATKTGLERAINNQAAFYKRLLDDFVKGLGEAKDFVVGALFGGFNDNPSLLQILFDAVLPTVVGVGLDIIAPGVGTATNTAIQAAQGIRDLAAELFKVVPKAMNNQPLDFGDWFGLTATSVGAVISLLPYIGSYLRNFVKIIGKGTKAATLLEELKKFGEPVVESIIDALKKLDWAELGRKAGSLLNKALELVEGLLRKLDDGAKALENLLTGALKLTPETVGASGIRNKGIITQTADAVSSVRSQAGSKVDELAPRIKQSLDDVAENAAHNASNALKLKYKLVFEQLQGQITKGDIAGEIIAGADKTIFKDASIWSQKYGGEIGDWVKRKSPSVKMEGIDDGIPVEVHWVENLKTGERYDWKLKDGFSQQEVYRP